MWRRFLVSGLFGVSSLALVACGDGNPFENPAGSDGDGTGEPPAGSNPILDSGTVRAGDDESPGPGNGDLTRLEARIGGGGLVSEVIYVADEDRFHVDGLGFDGTNAYSRGTPVAQLGPDGPGHAVYEADAVVPDFLTGEPIAQTQLYRAIYGVSTNNTSESDGRPRTSFAIVRTGGYQDYGFGGFLYTRNGSVTLPEGPFETGDSGQATFLGEYAGLRVFNGRTGLEYTQGNAHVDVDFRDFNSNEAVKGTITNRQVFDESGTEISTGTTLGDGQLLLPDIQFVVTEGLLPLAPNGEIAGNVVSYVPDQSGIQTVYESGTYYGVISGDLTDTADGGEIVGIIVLESTDNREENITVQETGGFIVYR